MRNSTELSRDLTPSFQKIFVYLETAHQKKIISARFWVSEMQTSHTLSPKYISPKHITITIQVDQWWMGLVHYYNHSQNLWIISLNHVCNLYHFTLEILSLLSSISDIKNVNETCILVTEWCRESSHKHPPPEGVIIISTLLGGGGIVKLMTVHLMNIF